MSEKFSLAGENFKVQQRIPVDLEAGAYEFKQNNNPSEAVNFLVIDTETTGLSVSDSEVIEIAGVELSVDPITGEAYSLTPKFGYFREPTRSKITPEITEITSITAEDVAGKNIDFDYLYKCFEEADIVAAHNAYFDRPFVEDVAPELIYKQNRWVCTCQDPNWKQFKYKKKNLEFLVQQIGYFYPAHRAINDAIATAWLLAHHPTAVVNLIQRANNETYKLILSSVPWGYNSGLKELGFKWQGKASGTFLAEFGCMDDALIAREGLQRLFQRAFSSIRIELKTVTAFTRFSAAI